MGIDYEQLLDESATCVNESKGKFLFLKERHIQLLWHEQNGFQKNLRASDGKSLEIVHPGIWNFEEGPDFLKAHIRIEGVDVHGDIEIHLHDHQWHSHKHQENPRYNGVILHVSLWNSGKGKPIVNSLGTTIPQLHLESFLEIPIEKISIMFDLELYPYQKYPGSGRCSEELFLHLPKNEIASFFKSAAKWRLKNKLRFMRNQSHSNLHPFGLGMAMALGYKNNARQFLSVFKSLTQLNVDQEEILYCLALGMCGFFEDSYKEKWSHSCYYRGLNRVYDSLSNHNLPYVKLNLSKIRPLNHPVRRLAALAKVISQQKVRNPFDDILRRWKERWGHLTSVSECRKLCEEFLNLLPHDQDVYWNHHYTFDESSKNDSLPFLGNDIKREILLNTVLPLLYEAVIAQSNSKELDAFDMLYETLSSNSISKNKYLSHRFFGDHADKELFKRAEISQGAFQLHRDFCEKYEASCVGCPFVDRFNRTFL